MSGQLSFFLQQSESEASHSVHGPNGKKYFKKCSSLTSRVKADACKCLILKKDYHGGLRKSEKIAVFVAGIAKILNYFN